jgi:hypothetical protein
LSNAENFDGFQRIKEKRRSLEEKAKTLEEKAFMKKLAIDKNLLVQILEEENRAHDDSVRELEEKIANWENQLKSSSPAENTPTQTTSEPSQEISTDVEKSVTPVELQSSEESTVQEFQEEPKKKKRSFF